MMRRRGKEMVRRTSLARRSVSAEGVVVVLGRISA